jgi:hypothetical protein
MQLQLRKKQELHKNAETNRIDFIEMQTQQTEKLCNAK